MIVSIAALTFTLVLALIISRKYKVEVIADFTKISASFCFIAMGLYYSSRLVFFGLIACAVGDFLILEAKKNKTALIASVASFILGHFVYIISFVQNNRSIVSTLSSGFALCLSIFSLSFTIKLPKGSDLKILTAYFSILIVMVSFAAGTLNPFLMFGSILFFISDLAVVKDLLNGSDKSYVWGLPLYYTGQLLIAFGG